MQNSISRKLLKQNKGGVKFSTSKSKILPFSKKQKAFNNSIIHNDHKLFQKQMPLFHKNFITQNKFSFAPQQKFQFSALKKKHSITSLNLLSIKIPTLTQNFVSWVGGKRLLAKPKSKTVPYNTTEGRKKIKKASSFSPERVGSFDISQFEWKPLPKNSRQEKKMAFKSYSEREAQRAEINKHATPEQKEEFLNEQRKLIEDVHTEMKKLNSKINIKNIAREVRGDRFEENQDLKHLRYSIKNASRPTPQEIHNFEEEASLLDPEIFYGQRGTAILFGGILISITRELKGNPITQNPLFQNQQATFLADYTVNIKDGKPDINGNEIEKLLESQDNENFIISSDPNAHFNVMLLLKCIEGSPSFKIYGEHSIPMLISTLFSDQKVGNQLNIFYHWKNKENPYSKFSDLLEKTFPTKRISAVTLGPFTEKDQDPILLSDSSIIPTQVSPFDPNFTVYARSGIDDVVQVGNRIKKRKDEFENSK